MVFQLGGGPRGYQRPTINKQLVMKYYPGLQPRQRPWRKWKNNISMDIREIGWEGVDWIELVQDRGQWRNNVNTE